MPTKRPNIVMVIADDTTPSYHGCYGGPTPTPHIDRLAAEGVQFERGYCNASLCCPSRYTLFTGQYTQRSRWAHQDTPPGDPALISQNGMLDPDTPTLAKVLRAAGYFTGHVGKWHSRFDTGEFGFDEPIIPEGDPDDPAVDAELRRRQANAQEVVRRCAGFEVAMRVNWGNIGGRMHEKIAKHNIGWLTDGALEFLDNASSREQPFYLHLANSVPHGPACQESFNVDHRYTWGGKLEQAPVSHPPDDTVLERMRAAGLRTDGPIAGVNAGQIQIDDQIGILLKKLEAMGELDNTIFIYTADHGIPGKGSCLMRGQHLPFVMRWPMGLPGGNVVSDIFSWCDAAPTLCDACGVAMPDGHRLDGTSVLGALRAETPWPRTVAYHEMGWSRSVIKGRYHYIATRYPSAAVKAFTEGDMSVTPGTGLFFDKLNAPFVPDFFTADQLYDLSTDPLERVNLIDDPTRVGVLEDLRRELRAITDTMPRPFPAEPNPVRESEQYQARLRERRAEVDAIRHYPDGDVPLIWYANLHDPGQAG